MDGKTDEQILSRTDNLLGLMKKVAQSIIAVSNDVGAGIVPENEIARIFRYIVEKSNEKNFISK